MHASKYKKNTCLHFAALLEQTDGIRENAVNNHKTINFTGKEM